MNGFWRMTYTDYSPSGPSSGQLGPFVGDVFQDLDSSKGEIKNLLKIQFPPVVGGLVGLQTVEDPSTWYAMTTNSYCWTKSWVVKSHKHVSTISIIGSEDVEYYLLMVYLRNSCCIYVYVCSLLSWFISTLSVRCFGDHSLLWFRRIEFDRVGNTFGGVFTPPSKRFKRGDQIRLWQVQTFFCSIHIYMHAHIHICILFVCTFEVMKWYRTGYITKYFQYRKALAVLHAVYL